MVHGLTLFSLQFTLPLIVFPSTFTESLILFSLKYVSPLSFSLWVFPPHLLFDINIFHYFCGHDITGHHMDTVLSHETKDGRRH